MSKEIVIATSLTMAQEHPKWKTIHSITDFFWLQLYIGRGLDEFVDGNREDLFFNIQVVRDLLNTWVFAAHDLKESPQNVKHQEKVLEAYYNLRTFPFPWESLDTMIWENMMKLMEKGGYQAPKWEQAPVKSILENIRALPDPEVVF